MRQKFMAIWLFLFAIMALLSGIEASEHKRAVTYGWGGRLGDNILDYAHAKWISYKWGVPLLLQPFQYSDQFVFDDVEEKLTPENKAQYTELMLGSMSQLDLPVNKNTLYFAAHVCDSYDEHVFNGSYGLYIPVDWNDKEFVNLMRTLIAPKQKLALTYPPAGVVSVALHYRTGGGFVWDTDGLKRGLPLRFPQVEYYIEQLKKLRTMVPNEPLYVHIFTDSPEPEQVRQIFRKAFPYRNIEFSCRVSGNRHDANVLEDMFSMMNFDCLIRPMSHYSMTASRLGEFKIDFVPTHGYWKHRKQFVVDKVSVIQKAYWDTKTRSWIKK